MANGKAKGKANGKLKANEERAKANGIYRKAKGKGGQGERWQDATLQFQRQPEYGKGKGKFAMRMRRKSLLANLKRDIRDLNRRHCHGDSVWDGSGCRLRKGRGKGKPKAPVVYADPYASETTIQRAFRLTPFKTVETCPTAASSECGSKSGREKAQCEGRWSHVSRRGRNNYKIPICSLGGSQGPRGGVVILKLALKTTGLSKATATGHAWGAAWAQYWGKLNPLQSHPCGEVCKYSVILTLTKKVTGGSSVPMLQSFAVVADATGGEDSKKADCPARGRACMPMIWVPDGIVRDALADVRFEVAGPLVRL